MKTIRRTKKEWLDNRGRILPVDQLKEVSKLWDEKTWAHFLDSIDGSIEGLQLLSAKRLSYKTAYMTHTIFDLLVENNESEKIQQIVQQGLMKYIKSLVSFFVKLERDGCFLVIKSNSGYSV